MKLQHPITTTLYPFQQRAIEETLHFLRNNPANACYNACEMGLGKTVQAIVAANTLDFQLQWGEARILIVCPAIMRLVWRKEIMRWALVGEKFFNEHLDPTCVILKSSDITKMFSQSWKYLIISYDLAAAPRITNYLADKHWDLMIMDEAHYLKNSRANRTKAVLQRLWPKADFKLALSGTPFTTRVVDGYTLFRRMLPGRWADFNAFAEEFSYCQIKNINGRTIRDYFGVKNAPALRELIRSSFYVRYTKEEVLTELPPKIYTRMPLPISYAVMPKAKEEAEELKIEAEMIRRAIESDKLPVIPRSLAEHRRLQGEKKAPAVVEFVADLLEQDIPVCVFAWHKNVIEALRVGLEAFNPSVITGDTESSRRQAEIERFQTGGTKLFIGNYIAAGVGVTLTASSTVVLAELDWSPATTAQAIDRLHRIGQTDTVNVYYFVVENSIDESISNTVMRRTRDFKRVLDNES